MRPDLTEELHFPATERATGADTATPIAIEAKQLPDAVQSKTTWLNRITQEMTMEEPVVESDIT